MARALLSVSNHLHHVQAYLIGGDDITAALHMFPLHVQTILQQICENKFMTRLSGT